MFWVWRPYALKELFFLIAAGILANVSQIYVSCLSPCSSWTDSTSQLYGDHFCGCLGLLSMARKIPDFYSLFGFGLILLAIILCSPLSQRQRKSL
jgi:hypothetical protein